MKLHLSLAHLVNTDKSIKAGDARTQDYLAPAVPSPVYIHANRVCYDALTKSREEK